MNRAGVQLEHESAQARQARLRAANRRLAYILVSVVAVFFFGIILKYWLVR